MHRLFAGLSLPEPTRNLLLDMMEDGLAVRWQEEPQLHLTLRFLGTVERPLAEDLAGALQQVTAPAFDLRLSGVGRFARPRGGALWAGVLPHEPLAFLAARIERAVQTCGIAPERRAFHPHVTLARWSGAQPDLEPFLRHHAGLRSEPWRVESFTLFESHLSRHGAHYEPILAVPLASQAG